MGAQMRIIPASEADQGFGLLREIVEMVKNPSAIDDAYERRRKAEALSESEIRKALEARAFINQEVALKAELKTREDNLATARAKHESDVGAHLERVASKEAHFAELEKQYSSVAAQQGGAQKDLEKKTSAVEARAKQIEDDLVAKEADYNARLKAIEDTEKEQQAENDRLIAERLKMRAKAERLASIAQIDD